VMAGSSNKTYRMGLRLRMLQEQGGLCCYCGVKMDMRVASNHPLAVTREHLKPRSQGGTDRVGNIRLACRKCNTARGAYNWLEWKTMRLGEWDEIAALERSA